jgi:hypothetical protein
MKDFTSSNKKRMVRPVKNDHMTDEEFRDERKFLLDAEREAASSFDKYMLTFSSGALGLSLTFIKELCKQPTCKYFLLYIAWAGFIATILCTSSSFLIAQRALSKQRDILDEFFYTKQLRPNWWATTTSYLNIFSIFSFITGIILLTIFIGLNLK